MTLGEVSHRLSAMIINNEASGKTRLIREIGAGLAPLLDPRQRLAGLRRAKPLRGVFSRAIRSEKTSSA
jgi:hypothetical protein